MDNRLGWDPSGFSVHAGVWVETNKEAVRLGRCMIRCPLLLQRLGGDGERGEVVYPIPLYRTLGGVARWMFLSLSPVSIGE